VWTKNFSNTTLQLVQKAAQQARMEQNEAKRVEEGQKTSDDLAHSDSRRTVADDQTATQIPL
jgi:hypothetical protein